MDKDLLHKPESELIDKILNGSNENYRVLVDRYSPMVFHVVRKFERDDDEAEELSQQIFVKAYEKLESYNRESKFSSWLYSIAMNHCRDYAKNIRRSNKRFSEMEPGYIELQAGDEKTPHLNLEVKEWKYLLKQAMLKLSSDYKEPFLMKYRDGISYEVMSEQLGVSVSALKVRVHRARKELKSILEKEV